MDIDPANHLVRGRAYCRHGQRPSLAFVCHFLQSCTCGAGCGLFLGGDGYICMDIGCGASFVRFASVGRCGDVASFYVALYWGLHLMGLVLGLLGA